MTRIAAQTPEEMIFRQNETPPTRAQKLEVMRLTIVELRAQVADLTARLEALEGGG